MVKDNEFTRNPMRPPHLLQDNAQKLFDAFSANAREVRSQYHLTLGGLITALGTLPPGMLVEFDRGYAPGTLESYRGYYSDLSFRPDGHEIPVIHVLEEAHAALGATFDGYKGGEYVMGDNTPLWVADHGSTGRAIVGFEQRDNKLILLTKDIS